MVSGPIDALIENRCNRIPNTSGCARKRGENGSGCPLNEGGSCTSRFQTRKPRLRDWA